MKNTETKLMYGSYHRHEIALLETVFSKNGAGYVISEKRTNRNIPYFMIESTLSKETEVSIRKEVKKITSRISNWGRKGYQKTV